MNKKINTTLILLLVGLIASIGTVNASPIDLTNYYVNSHDITVKQGETATIQARLYTYHYIMPRYIIFCPHALLFFTIKDKEGKVLALTHARTGKAHTMFPSCGEPAVWKVDTTGMSKGEHILTIQYYNCCFPLKKLAERQYQFNVV
jgi:uncharacterized protein YxeA